LNSQKRCYYHDKRYQDRENEKKELEENQARKVKERAEEEKRKAEEQAEADRVKARKKIEDLERRNLELTETLAEERREWEKERVENQNAQDSKEMKRLREENQELLKRIQEEERKRRASDEFVRLKVKNDQLEETRRGLGPRSDLEFGYMGGGSRFDSAYASDSEVSFKLPKGRKYNIAVGGPV
jgi:colicin import membrane protein